MIKIICVGKLKEKYLKDMVSDYQKRISKYHKIEIIEIPDTNLEEEKNQILTKLNKINNKFVITLEIKEKELDSISFAKKLNDLFISGYGNIVFIIGSSLGLSDKVKEISNCLLSFSKLTFPHGLFRAILLEQIYRAFKIINNEKYHK